PIGPAERVRRLPPSRQQLPDRVPWKQGASLSVGEFLTGTATRAFVVLHRGRLVEEWYGAATEPSSRLASWSVAKSLVSLLTQQAIDEGKLLMSSRVVDVLPWLRVTDPSQGDPGYNRITVRDLLDMTSGIDAPESYEADPTDPTFVTEISGLATGTYQLLVTPDLRSYARMHRQLVFTPGTRGEYISFNTQLLSMVVAKVLGQDLVTAFRERLWEPAGAQFRASWNLDRPGGTAKGFCCLNASARDFARLGLLIVEAGTKRSPVSRAWLDRLLTPRPRLVSGWPYSSSFWHIPGDQRGRRLADASAIGVFGQYIYVHPRTDTVIVKLSDYGIEQDEEATYRVFRAIARSW
ncbi:MAG: serine hydrolase, partial [Nocardioides sp.]